MGHKDYKMSELIEKPKFDHFHPVEYLDDLDGDAEETWTADEEKVVRRKIDMRVVPLVTLLYLLCFIDRANIGNARVIGMGADLKLDKYKYNWALTIFYIVYIFVEVPSNMILKRVGARIWIPFLVASFGAVSVGTSFVTDFKGLMVARAVLGFVEGGTMPGISFFLSQFYRREELLFRIGFFLSATSMAGAFGGLLATGLSKIPSWGVHGAMISSWRNIFFFEGLITILIAIVAPLSMPNGPGSCKFLTDRQRMIACERLIKEYKADSQEQTNVKHVRMATLNIMNTICAAGFLLANISVQSISLFMPTILNQMGFDKIQSQLHSVPPYVTAAACAIGVAFLSDRTRRRGIWLAAFSLISIIGFAILRSSVKSVGVKYMAIFFISIGAFPAGPGLLSWALNNSAGPAVQAVTSAYVVSIGTAGSVVATWTYLPEDGPNYPIGHSINLGAQVALAVVSLAGIFYCMRENKLRAAGKRDLRLNGLADKEKMDLGYLHPGFRYIP